MTAACWSLLLAALALFIAVRLVESVWLGLVVVGIVVAVVTAVIHVLRAKSRGW